MGTTFRLCHGCNAATIYKQPDKLCHSSRPNIDMEPQRQQVPAERPASLLEKEGMLIHAGEARPAFDWNRVVEEHRDERINDLAAL